MIGVLRHACEAARHTPPPGPNPVTRMREFACVRVSTCGKVPGLSQPTRERLMMAAVMCPGKRRWPSQGFPARPGQHARLSGQCCASARPRWSWFG